MTTRTNQIEDLPESVYEPTRGWLSLRLDEIWHYRELLYFLTWRDVKVRYKQTALGVAWAVLQPLITMVIFSVIFGQLAKLPSDGIPYLDAESFHSAVLLGHLAIEQSQKSREIML